MFELQHLPFPLLYFEYIYIIYPSFLRTCHRSFSYYPGKRPQTVFVRSISRKSRDLDALGSREVMVMMKAVGVVVSECE